MNPTLPSIDQLQEMPLPPPPAYLPQTWGWAVLLALLLLGALAWGARRYWRWRRDAYRREALAQLARLQASDERIHALRALPELLKRVALSMPAPISLRRGRPADPDLVAAAFAGEPAPTTAEPPHTSGRSRLAGEALAAAHSALAGKPAPTARHGVATLQGAGWQAFLQQHCPLPLPEDFSQQLALLAYAPQAQLQALSPAQQQQLFEQCRTWVEQHHVAA